MTNAEKISEALKEALYELGELWDLHSELESKLIDLDEAIVKVEKIVSGMSETPNV